MAVGYSKDMRERGLKLMKDGFTQEEVSKMLGVGARTLRIWKKIHKETGRTAPIINGSLNKGKPSKIRQIKDEKEFEKFVNENCFCTKKQLAEKWEKKTGQKATIDGVDSALKRINFSFKKKLKNTNKQTKNKEGSMKYCLMKRKAEIKTFVI